MHTFRSITVLCPAYKAGDDGKSCQQLPLGKAESTFHSLAVLVYDTGGVPIGCGQLYSELFASIKPDTPKQPLGGAISMTMKVTRMQIEGVLSGCTAGVYALIHERPCDDPGPVLFLQKTGTRSLTATPQIETSFCIISGMVSINYERGTFDVSGRSLIIYDTKTDTRLGCGVLTPTFAVTDIENEVNQNGQLIKPLWGKFPVYDQYAPRGGMAFTYHYGQYPCPPLYEFDAKLDLASPVFDHCERLQGEEFRQCSIKSCQDECDNHRDCEGFAISPGNDGNSVRCYLKRKGFVGCKGLQIADVDVDKPKFFTHTPMRTSFKGGVSE